MKGNKEKSNQQQNQHGKAQKKKAAVDNEDLKRDQKLQAILLADSFTTTFRPISIDTPKVLLPLVNVPMINYTIEFLAQSGVEEILVFSVSHADLIQKHVNTLKIPKVTITCLSSSTCLSAGDALREIDTMGIVRSDPFILVNGDVISNMNLKAAIKFHKERRKLDPNAVMTTVLRNVSKRTGLRSIYDDLVVALDANTSQVLLFEDDIDSPKFSLPTDLLKEHHNVKFFSGLLDCHIDICSPELLLQFSDNFDYQNIRRHFIQNEVVNWEMGKHIFAYILPPNEYAARVLDPRIYHTVSKDITHRWTFPIVPDTHILHGNGYQHHKSYLYKDENVKVARTASIKDGVVLGKGTIVADNVLIRKSVIGSNCIIEKGAVIENSYIWDGTIIASNVKVVSSIICSNVRINEGVTIARGCLIANDIVIQPNVNIPEFTRLSKSDEVATPDSKEGKEFNGYVWRRTTEDDFGLELVIESFEENKLSATEIDSKLISSITMGCHELEKWKSELWTTIPLPEDDDLNESYDGFTDGSHFIDDSGNAEVVSTKQIVANENFAKAVSDTVITGREQKHAADTLVLEIKSFKLSQNKEYSDCLKAVIPALLGIAVKDSSLKPAGNAQKTTFNLINTLKELLAEKQWGNQMLRGLVFNDVDRLCVIECVEDTLLQPERSGDLYPIFRYILQILYDSEILNEEVLLDWADQRANEESSPRATLFSSPSVQEFVEWLKEEDDDDDDEEDEEEDD